MKISELEENAAMVASLMKAFAQNMARRAGTAAGAAERTLPKVAGSAEKTAATATTAAARTATTLADQIAQQAAAKGVRLEPLTAQVWDKSTNKFIERAIPIVNHDGRAMVVVKVNGERVPFYLSSGSVPKEGIIPGQWYPTFGIGPDGWINKAANAGTYYGRPALKRAAEQLDAAIGDIRSKLGNNADFGVGKTATGSINQGLAPVTYEQGLKGALKEPAYELFKRIGA